MATSDRSVATLHPDWRLHPTLYTGTKTVETLTVGSSERVFWLCPGGEDHIWEGVVASRHRGRSACQTCRKIPSTTNSVAVLHSDWALHPTRYTGRRTVETLAVGSSERVAWLCPEGEDHFWNGRVIDRQKGRSVCRTCRVGCDTANPVATLHDDGVQRSTR